MNPCRVDYIRRQCEEHFGRTPTAAGAGKPLRGLKALDVGCGGGLLSEVSQHAQDHSDSICSLNVECCLLYCKPQESQIISSAGAFFVLHL
jgi:hypothetical protein